MAVKASAQQTIVDLTDAYNVYLTCASYTFPGTTSTAKAASCTTQVVAMRGPDQVSATVDPKACTCPTGVSVASDGDASAPTLTVSVTTAVTGPGKVTIPVTVDGDISFTLEFAYGVALTGATGAKGDKGTSVTVSSTKAEYQASASGTSVPTGTWSASPVTGTAGQFVWTRTTVTFSDGKTAVSYAVARQGTNGTNGTSVAVSSTKTEYQAGTSGTTAPTGTWSSSPVAGSAGGYVWTRTTVTFSDGKTAVSYAVSRNGTNGTNGTNGKDGAAAITMAITSSAGFIFKNAKISTTLTAHVYRGGVEVTGSSLTALGTIRWYRDGATTAAGTGQTFSVSASDVGTTMNVTAQLEG